KQMVLIYAINHSSLSGDLTQNERQMLNAMSDFNTDEYKVLLYKYVFSSSDNPEANPGLFEITNVNGVLSFKLVKEYDKSMLSVNSERISQVLDDAISLYPKAEKDLFFWGHGNGWVTPSKYSPTKEVAGGTDVKSASGDNKLLNPQSFGGEYISDSSVKTEFIDIDELADAIPDNVFKSIWFDCCYMSAIEVAYQLRNKCDTYVAYPTEIMAEGLPYSKVLPHILHNRNFIAAAKELYDYYTNKTTPLPVTVAVMRMDKIYEVAEVAKDIYALGESRPSTGGMQNYSRFSNAPYWDFGQYMREYIKANSADNDKALSETLQSRLAESLKEFVVFSEASDFDFNYYARPILKENFSGISTHNYEGRNTEREAFYRTLDWYKATRGSKD
ncbi:MAG: hypothetical protein K2K97_07800, partial [Muribaculaceae bacterium]|nr:hypothetical protein [Muribaculaceae bacterium]